MRALLASLPKTAIIIIKSSPQVIFALWINCVKLNLRQGFE